MPHPLETLLNYHFQDKRLLEEALTHPSLRKFGNRNNERDFERMEFLGDSVLGLIIATLLYKTYPDEREGELARRLSALVCGATTAQVAQQLELGDHLKMTLGEQETGGRENITNLEDVCEALIGAIYLDGGLEAAERIVLHYWSPLAKQLTEPPKDPKSGLQEWAQARNLPLPEYTLLSTEGPDHAPIFTLSVSVEGYEPTTASGASKKNAMREAAATLLEQLETNEASSS